MPSLTPPAPQNFIESLRSRIVEGRTLDPYEYRPVVVPVQVTLGSARQQGTATFTIPSNQRMLIRQFVPIVVPRDVSSASDSPTGQFTVGIPAAGDVFAGGTIEDRLYAKAQNCRIDLGLNSRMFNLFQQLSFPLASLMSYNGEIAGLADMPGILVQGTTIDLTASLSDLGAAGGDTEYGIAILGAYVQV